MKKHITYLILLLFFSYSYGQEIQNKKYSDQYIEDCIREVFQDQADVLVLNSNSIRYSFMSNFIKNQVTVEYHPEYKGKGFVSTNSLPLNNKYNAKIKRDIFYSSSTFNPLKYQFSMNPNKKTIYRIGTTDYLMIISPSK